MAVFKYKTADGYKTLEVPTVQRAVMPNIDGIPLGTIVQYTGATAGNFVNGYFYKAVESSEIVQVNYYGYTQGSGDYRTDLFSKEGQTEGYYYSSTTSASAMKSLPNFTVLDGSKYVKDGTTDNFEDAPNMAEGRVYPFVSGSTSTTMKVRIKNGSSYMESSNTVTLERKSSIDTTREETVVTKTWQQVNVQPSSAGEAESYNDLTNKPAINGHTLGGDQTGEALGLTDMPDYSAGEHKVGIWVDGSTIYERAFTITGFAKMVAGSTYEIITTPRATYGIDKLISGSVMVKTVAVQDNTTPIYTINNGHFWNNEYDDVIKFVPSYALGSNAPQDIKEMYAILRYTKVQS